MIIFAKRRVIQHCRRLVKVALHKTIYFSSAKIGDFATSPMYRLPAPPRPVLPLA